jgi:hypothetical protein
MNLSSMNSAGDNRRWASNPAAATKPRQLPHSLSTEGAYASSPTRSDEIAGPLYDRVLERVRKNGRTVPAEKVLGQLDADDS